MGLALDETGRVGRGRTWRAGGQVARRGEPPEHRRAMATELHGELSPRAPGRTAAMGVAGRSNEARDGPAYVRERPS
jgi:hypothetical protein